MSESGSPPKPSYGRIAHHGGFLPLNTEEVLSPRGGRLPSIIRAASSGSLHGPPMQHVPRRPSSLRAASPDLEASEFRAGDGGENGWSGNERQDAWAKAAAQVLMNPAMRSMRLIGNSNPRYQWENYIKTEEELKKMKKPIRKYYERNNGLISQYMFIDRLLDSSLPHTLIQEYNQPAHGVNVPSTIEEEPSKSPPREDQPSAQSTSTPDSEGTSVKVKRTPKNIYKVPDEATPLMANRESSQQPPRQELEEPEDESKVVSMAIAINFAANAILLAAKIVVILLTSSLSVLASLVDAALDFLSTAIIWTTTYLIKHRQDRYAYPIGRRRLEPIGVLVFSVIMITSFFQVMLECFSRLTSGDHTIVQLTLPAIIIMASTVVVKGICWLYCRLIPNSSVQALALDAETDVYFNLASIIFPMIGFYMRLWWLDALGGLFLSLYVMVNWARTSSTHIRNLSGAAASADERNVLLYLTMRFARTIISIQGLQAYHSGDTLTCEVDVVLSPQMPLRDSHDLCESLQYVLESHPLVDRAFVHADYQTYNLPSHMAQQE